MPTVKLYDPYKLVDPTKPMPAPVESRTIGGKFNGYSQLAAAGDENFPIESRYWERYARGAWAGLEKITGAEKRAELVEAIFPGPTIDLFSWRTICEVVEAARDQAKVTPDDSKAIVNAAHRFLAGLQYKVAMQHMVATDKNGALDLKELAADFPFLDWDNLLEVTYE